MFKKILFCTDFSENSNYAFTYALNLAKTYKGKLFILHVIPEPVDIYRPTEQQEALVKKYQKKAIDEEVTTHYVKEMTGFKDYKLLLKEGVVFNEIIETAKDEAASIIVMGTHGRMGLEDILMGSTAERVVRKSPVPVLTVRLPGK
ncbi:MAG: universal stress protein [Deltaproteobacteria bacterium]